MSRLNMYNLFVKDNGDVLGQIAYALYKKDKHDYIRRINLDLKGEALPEYRIEDFKQINSTPAAIERYRSQAKKISREFFHEVMQEYKGKLDSSYIKEYRKLSRSVSLWSGVLSSVIGSIIFVFIGYLILNYSGVWDVLITKLLGM